MNHRQTDALDTLIADATHTGLLPAGTVRPPQDVRPWPLVLMTAFGAWLAAIPLILALGFGLESLMREGPAAYIVAIIVLVGAVSVIRARDIPLFVEQLAVPCLLVGGGLLGYALFRDLPGPFPYWLLSALCLLVAAALPRDWLRVLLGLLACGTLALATGAGGRDWFGGGDPATLFIAWMLALAIWLGAHWLQEKVFNDGRGARVAACIESISTGWVLAVLLGLISWSGMTFMLGAVLGHGLTGEATRELSGYFGGGWYSLVLPGLSVLLALAAAGWLFRHWPSLRQLPAIGVALVLIALAWCMPALGPVLLILAFCLASGRTRVATAAAVAAAWVIGSFYYQLAWTLASKAALLAVAGAVLCALAWLTTRGTLLHLAERGVAGKLQHGRLSQFGLVAGLLLVLLVVNGGIWQKQQLIAKGEPVFVELAPVDPRSLMQGDFMRLNFLQLGMLSVEASVHGAGGRPHVVAMRDARGVAEIHRLYDGKPLLPGEFLMELTPKDGSWVLVSDAWFFKEGDAARWEKARYGEFRVMPDGRALLVGMRGPQLEAL
ncbi:MULTISPECIES: GDYXXLXY domain-containing protein [unclassified Janthinobacterium]|uniref:GDYXXLXY domain-containing protein n=1 Tax=unclassified Janthinobacterium TaxID=2610881 RepID=UPI001615A4FE|nr:MULTISPECIES: GDYXXLXY domain-containing protein [unclassified Janthinobacterium]MBB5367806.1 putative membrane-anchored protein [Janthinobacterium sp. K2C7]MBB5379716.1 putative membrane-anchored protein [Janthinobacterium sp. K2Li3]MBB5386188.1 putative membrane-anchored protein [Janthinobacterium sp. K2E3]